MATAISVQANVDGLTKALEEVRSEVKTTGREIDNGLNLSKALAQVKKLRAEYAGLKKDIEKIGGDKRLTANLKNTGAELGRLQTKITSMGGHAGAAHQDAAAEGERARRARKAKDRASIGGWDDLSWRQKGRAGRVAGSIGGMIGGAIGGGGGMSIGTMAGAGAGGLAGMLPGIFGMIGGPLIGGLVGGIGRALDQAMTDVLAEGMKASNLTRAFASTAASFREVRDAARDAADGMGVSYVDSAQHASDYARIGAMRAPDGLAESLRDAYGFGRGLGVGQGVGVNFMATLRGTGAAGDEKTARKIGLEVAAAIQKGGLGPQANEVLQAIQGFASTAAQANFRAPDIGGFASLMAAGNNLNLPGLHAGGMASILGSADAAIRQGGNMGLPSQIISHDALARLNPDMEVLDLKRIQQGGLLGTAEGAFGENSAAVAAARARLEKAQKNGDANEAKKAQADLDNYHRYATGPNAKISNMSAQIDRIRAMGGKTNEVSSGLANHFGLTMDQADALQASYDKMGGFGGIEDRIKKAGLDPSKIKTQAMNDIAGVTGMNHDQMRNLANQMLGGDGFKRLGKADSDALLAAKNGGDTEKFRDVIMKLLDKTGGRLSDPEKNYQAQTDIKNEIMKFATDLVPITTEIKGYVAAIVGKIAPETAVGRFEGFKSKMSSAGVTKDDQEEILKTIHEFHKARESGDTKKLDELNIKRNDLARKYGLGFMFAADDFTARSYATRDSIKLTEPKRDNPENLQQPTDTPSAGGTAQPASPRPLGTGAAIAPPGATASAVAVSGKQRILGLSDGSTETRTGGSRSWRNNNPGNIEYGKFALANGAIGSDGRFAIFGSHEQGRTAKEKLLFEGKKYRDLTLSQAIARYAPPSENNTGAYQQSMLAAVGGSNRTMSSYAPEERSKLLDAMQRHEGFRVGRVNIDQTDPFKAPIPPDPRTAAANPANGTTRVDVRVTVEDSKGRSRDDVKAEVVRTSYRSQPAGVSAFA